MNIDGILLKTDKSKEIYESYMKQVPICDYHCHLKAKDIYEDKTFRNLTELWLDKDHYKWRLMRANGVPEKYITGDATDKEKYIEWMQTLEKSIGNPIQIWSKMELNQFFNIKKDISNENVETIWQEANEQLGEDGLSVREILLNCSVRLVGTTDNPLDDLEYHKKIKRELSEIRVIPTMRIDNFVYVNKDFINKINDTFNIEIGSLEEFLVFINNRIDYFKENGCQSLDLGIGELITLETSTNVYTTFNKIIAGESVIPKELSDLQTFILTNIVKRSVKLNWVLQMHIGAVGSVNNKARSELGTGTGFDTVIDQSNFATNLLGLLNTFNNQGILPKIIIYNADGSKNNIVQTVMGCFQANEKRIQSKIQHGPAWWFQDTYEGNYKQLVSLSEQGIIGNFIGMTTDSRSYISYARHDFFRRVLANVFSEWISLGIISEEKDLQKITEDICYNNAIHYFNL